MRRPGNSGATTQGPFGCSSHSPSGARRCCHSQQLDGQVQFSGVVLSSSSISAPSKTRHRRSSLRFFSSRTVPTVGKMPLCLLLLVLRDKRECVNAHVQAAGCDAMLRGGESGDATGLTKCGMELWGVKEVEVGGGLRNF